MHKTGHFSQFWSLHSKMHVFGMKLKILANKPTKLIKQHLYGIMWEKFSTQNFGPMGHPWGTWGLDLRRDGTEYFQNIISSLSGVHMTSLHHWIPSHLKKILVTFAIGVATPSLETLLQIQNHTTITIYIKENPDFRSCPVFSETTDPILKLDGSSD